MLDDLEHKRPAKKPVDTVLSAKVEELNQKALTIIVVGASGHLARTKTFPALCALYNAVWTCRVPAVLPDAVAITAYCPPLFCHAGSAAARYRVYRGLCSIKVQ